jgi:predicted peroxiredoxin
MHPVGDAHVPQALTPLPGMTAMATHMLKKQIAGLGAPEVPEFLDQIVAAGGHLWACRTSADMNKLTEADLRDVSRSMPAGMSPGTACPSPD